MNKKSAQQIVSSAHHAAQAISRARSDLPEPRQDELYSRTYLNLLDDTIGAMSIRDLLDVLAQS